MNQNNTYPLNALDNYNILAFGTAIENVPCFHDRLDQSVNPDQLAQSCQKSSDPIPTFSDKAVLQ